MTELKIGQQVVTTVSTVGFADGLCGHVHMAPGTPGRVVDIREAAIPDAWLYDIEFRVTVAGKPDTVLVTFDAVDLLNLHTVAELVPTRALPTRCPD